MKTRLQFDFIKSTKSDDHVVRCHPAGERKRGRKTVDAIFRGARRCRRGISRGSARANSRDRPRARWCVATLMPSDIALPQSITVATLPGHIEQKYLIIHVEQHVNYCNFNIVRHFLHDEVRRMRYEPGQGQREEYAARRGTCNFYFNTMYWKYVWSRPRQITPQATPRVTIVSDPPDILLRVKLLWFLILSLIKIL